MQCEEQMPSSYAHSNNPRPTWPQPREKKTSSRGKETSSNTKKRNCVCNSTSRKTNMEALRRERDFWDRNRALQRSEAELRAQLKATMERGARLQTELDQSENQREQFEIERDHYWTERDRQRDHCCVLRNRYNTCPLNSQLRRRLPTTNLPSFSHLSRRLLISFRRSLKNLLLSQHLLLDLSMGLTGEREEGAEGATHNKALVVEAEGMRW